MSNPVILILLSAIVAFILGAVMTWLFSRNKTQSESFQLTQQLAERTQQYQFTHESLTKIQADLDTSRSNTQHLHTEIQDLHSRLATATQQYQFAHDSLTHAQADLNASRSDAQNLHAEIQDLHSRLAAATQQIKHLQEQLQGTHLLKQDYADLQQTAQNLHIQNGRLNTQIEQERQAADEKLALLMEARQSLSDQFQNLANQILEEKSRRFTEHNREHLGQLLNPLNERLHGFSELVQNTYEKEARERLTLENELKRLQGLNNQLHHDAKALTDALIGTKNKTQGNWGEMILETVLENSGLQKGREYVIQAASTRQEEDGSTRRLQPDVLINLPDNKQIVIDSKVSLTAYTRYVQAGTPEEAARELSAHIASIRAHIKGLSLKNYTDLDGVNTLDFVFMFIPVEPAYLLALQQDDQLFQECFDKRIMIVGPSTLLATLRTVANIWRYEQQNQNALAIAEEGGRLYDKFVGFVGTLESIGKNIDQAQNQYQTAYKQLVEGRGNLVNRAEKLRQLGVKTVKQLDKQLVERSQDGLTFSEPEH